MHFLPAELHDAALVGGFPLLEFDRKPLDRYPVTAFAITWNSDLTLVQWIDHEQFRLNGYGVFRNSDVRRWRCISSDEFCARAARLHRLRPCAPAGVTITSVREAVSSAGKAWPLVAVYGERTKRGVFSVGKVKETSQRAVRLIHISPDAEWEEDETRLFRDITLLKFGGTYENLLARMARGLP